MLRCLALASSLLAETQTFYKRVLEWVNAAVRWEEGLSCFKV